MTRLNLSRKSLLALAALLLLGALLILQLGLRSGRGSETADAPRTARNYPTNPRPTHRRSAPASAGWRRFAFWGASASAREAAAPARLLVRIVDAHTERPVADVSVTTASHPFRMSPDTSATVELADLPDRAEVWLRAEAPGYAPVLLAHRVSGGASGTMELTLRMGEGITVIGRVVRFGSQEPLPGFPIQADAVVPPTGREEHAAAVSGADGRFRIAHLPPGRVKVSVRPDPPLREISRLAYSGWHGGVCDLGDLELGTGGGIRGRLIRLPAGAGIAGTTVTASSSEYWPLVFRSVTDPEGSFAFQNLPAGYYQVTSNQSGASGDVSVRHGETAEVTLRVGSGILAGMVLADGEPTRGSVQMMRGESTIAQKYLQPGGGFEFRDLPPGPYKLQIGAMDGSGTFDVDFPESGTTTPTFELFERNIVGRVIDSDGKPAGGVGVYQVPTSGTADLNRADSSSGLLDRTQPDGTFKVRRPPAGPMRIMASAGSRGNSDPVDVVAPPRGDSPSFVLLLNSPEGRTGTLSLSAVDSRTKLPGPACRLTLRTPDGRPLPDGEWRRNEDGIYETELPAGRYTLRAVAPYCTPAEETVEIAPGEVRPVRLELSPAGHLSVAVADEKGLPVSGALCSAIPLAASSSGDIPGGATSPHGLWRSAALLPGRYEVLVTLPGGRELRRPVTIDAGQTAVVSLETH